MLLTVIIVSNIIDPMRSRYRPLLGAGFAPGGYAVRCRFEVWLRLQMLGGQGGGEDGDECGGTVFDGS
jgi:hypothetical protein